MRFAALVLILACGPAFGLGLGEPQVHSHFGEALRVDVPIHGIASGIVNLQVEGQQPSDISSALPFVLGPSRYRTVIRPLNDEQAVLEIHGREPMQELAVRVYLTVSDGAARVEKVIDVLLDPAPSAKPQKPLAQDKQGLPQSAVRSGSSARSNAGSSTESTAVQRPLRSAPSEDPRIVQPGDTLSAIAERLRRPPGVSFSEFVSLLQQANPHAFRNPSQAKTLIVGARLRIPNVAERKEGDKGSSTPHPKVEISARDKAVFLRPGMFALQTQLQTHLQTRERQHDEAPPLSTEVPVATIPPEQKVENSASDADKPQLKTGSPTVLPRVATEIRGLNSSPGVAVKPTATLGVATKKAQSESQPEAEERTHHFDDSNVILRLILAVVLLGLAIRWWRDKTRVVKAPLITMRSDAAPPATPQVTADLMDRRPDINAATESVLRRIRGLRVRSSLTDSQRSTLEQATQLALRGDTDQANGLLATLFFDSGSQNDVDTVSQSVSVVDLTEELHSVNLSDEGKQLQIVLQKIASIRERELDSIQLQELGIAETMAKRGHLHEAEEILRRL